MTPVSGQVNMDTTKIAYIVCAVAFYYKSYSAATQTFYKDSHRRARSSVHTFEVVDQSSIYEPSGEDGENYQLEIRLGLFCGGRYNTKHNEC
jgi:hypothetical protein